MATKKSYETPAAMYKMVAMEEALDRVLSHARGVFEEQQRGPGASEETSVHECVGCVLAEHIAAPTDFPDRPLSIMVSQRATSTALLAGGRAAKADSIVPPPTDSHASLSPSLCLSACCCAAGACDAVLRGVSAVTRNRTALR